MATRYQIAFVPTYDLEFGDGSNTDVTRTVDGTLVRDMYYNNLTINDGVKLNTANFKIFVRGTLNLNSTGSIVNPGNNGGNGSNGGIGAGGSGGAGGAALSQGSNGKNFIAGIGGSTGGNSVADGAGSSSAPVSAGGNETNSVVPMAANAGVAGGGGGAASGNSGGGGNPGNFAAGTAAASTAAAGNPPLDYMSIRSLKVIGSGLTPIGAHAQNGGSCGGGSGAYSLGV
jgi:hypothetical protein